MLQGSDAGREARVGGGLLASRCHSSGKQAVWSKHIRTLAILHAFAVVAVKRCSRMSKALLCVGWFSKPHNKPASPV